MFLLIWRSEALCAWFTCEQKFPPCSPTALMMFIACWRLYVSKTLIRLRLQLPWPRIADSNNLAACFPLLLVGCACAISTNASTERTPSPQIFVLIWITYFFHPKLRTVWQRWSELHLRRRFSTREISVFRADLIFMCASRDVWELSKAYLKKAQTHRNIK